MNYEYIFKVINIYIFIKKYMNKTNIGMIIQFIDNADLEHIYWGHKEKNFINPKV